MLSSEPVRHVLALALVVVSRDILPTRPPDLTD